MTKQETKAASAAELWDLINPAANASTESNVDEIDASTTIILETAPKQEPAPAETSEPASTAVAGGANTESSNTSPNPILAAAISSALQTIPAISEFTQIKPITNPQGVVAELKNHVFTNQYGVACLAITDGENYFAVIIGSSAGKAAINDAMAKIGINLNKQNLLDVIDILKSHAEKSGKRIDTWNRVAPVLVDGVHVGVEIDLGNDQLTRVKITEAKVEMIHKGSKTLFLRSKLSMALVMPAEIGNRNLIKKYLNMTSVAAFLFVAWLTYIMSHPKLSTSKYPILLLQGSEGTGKSFLCNQIILALLDPSVVGLQMIPNNLKDLAIASQNNQVLAYDNVRAIQPFMSDILCVAATGGSMSTRQLYTDADQSVIHLHVALVLNGIYSFVTQPDLAQRCLPIQLSPIPETARRSETAMVRELQDDLPAILKGLYDLVAKIFTHLPNAEVTNPERMIDFVYWLAAMEKADEVPAGIYQAVYSDALNQCRLDALQDSLLATAIMDFMEYHVAKGKWTGSPSELLIDLNKHVDAGSIRSREWPQNAIALSKRIIPLQSSLLAQGISIELSRGKNRTITIIFNGLAAATSKY
ncbi:MAG: hypothetical protein HOP25_09840 [Methylotenera sp.]|nr:hypothetical protein [Methylotenera sp.]